MTKTGIPGTEKIISDAFGDVTKKTSQKLKPDYIRKNFSELNELLFYRAYEIYIKHEEKVKADLAKSILARSNKKSYSPKDVEEILLAAVPEAARFEKSLMQSRASRAGKSYELIVMRLLDIMKIPNEHITKEDKKSGLRPIDIVIPDRKTAIENPDQAQFLSLKTSLKDRWKLVVEDQKQGQRTHLLTLLQNERISKDVVDKIYDKGIFLYIPDGKKEDLFPNNPRIRNLSDLPSKIGKA